MSTGEPAGEGGGGGGESTPGGDHSVGTPGVGIPSGIQTGIQHPPPSPLSGCYLLVVLPEPHTAQHKDLIVNRLAKGFLSWDKDSCHVDLEKELQALVTQAPEGEEARNGERLIQYATENLVTEVLIHPQTNTLLQCIRNLLASFTKHRHIIHAGYTFSGNGSWILQDGTFSLADFLDAFSEHEVQRVIRAYENSVTVDIHCAGVGDWTSSRLSKEACARVRVNPDDVLTAGVPAISNFTEYIGQYLVAQTLDQLMEPSDVVGNIRFSHPTLYVFPGGQGDAALFGINGFNMLVDGGFARKACFWDFARHLDRLDAVLLTRVNNSNIGGMSSVLRKKQEMHVYPQIGHFFCNLVERRGANSPDGDKDVDPLILNLTDLGQEMMVNLRHINLRAHPCYRDLDPINLYHKVGHGTLDMYVLSPSKDTREVREFLTKWQTSDSKLFAGSHKKDSNHLTFPIQNLVSICALLVWQPANPEDTITRILFPGSTPQNKIFEGLERLKHLEFMKHPICSAKSLSPSTSLAALKEKSNKQKTSIIEKSIDKDKDKDIKRVSDYKKEKKETLDTKTVKGADESSPKPAVPSAPIIPTKQPAKVDVKAKKVVENKKIEKETKTDSKKIEKDLKEVKKETVKREVVRIDKQEVETKKTDVVKTEIEKTAITKESKPKPEPKRKEIKETRTVVKSKVETQPKAAPKPTVDKKLKPSIDKKDVKSSPTTPKKIINGTASRTEISKTSTKTMVKTTTSRTVSAMPAKSAKDATNRKVVESKNLTTSSTTPTAPAPKAPSVTAKPRSTDRKPISRRPKTGSPSKPRLSGSPAKSTRSAPAAPPKTEKDSVIRRPKVDKVVTDASTPSAIQLDSVVKLVDKSLTEKSDDISIDSIESKVLADLKEEREVVEEIEAVLSKAERNEIARKDDQLEGDDEITAEATDKKEDDVTEEDVTAEIEDVPKKIGSRKESQEFTEEDEYLIVEKEEIYTEDSALSGEGEQKHLLDEVESEKAKKYEVSKDLDVPEEDEEPKEKDEMEEKEKDEKRERKIQFNEKPEDEDKKTAGLSPTRKEQLEGEVKDIITSATEMVHKTDERDDSGKKDSEDITKEPSSVSPDKFDSSEKKTTDTDLKPEVDQKEQVPEKLEESQDRISTLESGATTTAPTLPEDERITLDEIKEDVDEKHVKEEVKEKEIPQPVKDKLPEIPPPVPTAMMKPFVIRETVTTVQRDIVKTPDEVADLPVHEEVDPKLYDMDDYDKVKEEKVPQTPEAKEPPTPPVKEQKGMFSFFGKVADKFEKGMDKLTGKSKKDAEKEADEKSSKSSSPKETRPQDKASFEDMDMGKVFAKVGKVEPHTTDTFEKAKPQSTVDIKVAAIKETAAFLQQEIKETKIDTVHTVEPVIPADTKLLDTKEPVEEIAVLKDVAQKLDTAIDGSKDKPLDLTSKKEEILSEELVEDTKEVEALLEEASKKFVKVKDSLRDSLESLEDKIEDIVDEMRPIDAKDTVKSTLTGVAERLEEFKPQFDDIADTKEPNKVKFEIPKYGEDVEDGDDDSDEYSGPIRDVKGAVRDVGEVLAGTAGIVIDDKPKDVIEIVKKVAEVLKEDNFLSEQILFDKPTAKAGEKPADEKPQETSHPKPIIEDMIMPKKVGITEELPPQEEIEEMLEGGIARPLPAYERAGGFEVEEEPCVKMVKDVKVDIKSPMKESAPLGDDVKDLCSDLIEVAKKPITKRSVVDHHEGKVDVMEAGIEEVCTKKEVKRELADEDEKIEDDQELEQSEILFQQKLAPTQAELVMVTPDSAPTSPKFSADKVYDKELEDAVADVSKVPGVPKEIEEFISSKADVYDIIDEVIKKGRKITIEIIEYIVVVKKVSREHVIYIIEEIIINKGISPESVIEDVEILKSQESTNDLIISSVKRVEIEEYIIAEYIMKGKRITILTIEEIAIKKVVPKRIVIEIIEEIIIKRKISRESVYQMTEEEFVKEVQPIYDEFEREPRRESQETVDHKSQVVDETEKSKPIDEKPSDIIAAEVEEKSPKDDQSKGPAEVPKQQPLEPSKEKDAPIFDEKDLDEGKLIDDFVNVSSRDAVINFLHEERRLSDEEYTQAEQDSDTISKPESKITVTDDTVKDSGDDFEAVEQEYKVHDVPTTTASTVHAITDLKDKDDVLEAVEDDLDDVVEAAEKFVEETKEKPEASKEIYAFDTMADKMPEKDSLPVKPDTKLVPEVKDDKILPVTSDAVIVSEVSIAKEKYLDEEKEKTTIITKESPKQSTHDEFEDAIKDTDAVLAHKIQDVYKDAAPKLEKLEPETDEKDHSKETPTDKHDVAAKVGEKEPVHEEKTHVTDVTVRSPLDDKGGHPELVDIATIDEPVKELKEKPEGLKETSVTDAVVDKVPEKDSVPVKPAELVPEIKDDKILPETSDDGIDDIVSVIASEVSNATEKYLDEDKEKTTAPASESPKQSKDEPKIEDVIKDTVVDVSHEIHDVKDAVPKLDKMEPSTDEKEDHLKETPADKHDVDAKVGDTELAHDDKSHVTDVAIRDSRDDKEDHPELKVDIEARISPVKDMITDKIHETGDKVDKEDHIDDTKVDTVKDVSHEIHDAKDAATKLDKPEPKTDEKEDQPKETSTDKHDLDANVSEEEPVHKEEAHLTDVTMRSPRDDKGQHPELNVDIETIPHTTQEPEEKTEKPGHIEKKEIGKEDGKEIVQNSEVVAPIVDKTGQPEQLDKKISEPAEIKKSSSKDSVKDDSESSDAVKKLEDVKEKIEEAKDKDIVPEMTDIRILDTSEIVDLKQFEIEVDEKKDDKETDKVSKETAPALPGHSAGQMIPDSSCFNIGKPETPPAPIKEVPVDDHDEMEFKLDKLPKHPDVGKKDTGLDDIEKEPDHSIRRKRSLGEYVSEPEELDEEPKDAVRKSVDSTPSLTEKDQTTPKSLAPASVEQGSEKPEDDDDKELGTVRRMVVTASSEDGGHETELCPTGSIIFGKSVTPDDSLKDVSTKSTPDKDSLLLEKDSLYSGKSTPEKDSISEKSVSDLKDDKGTPDDSLEKSITGAPGHGVVDEARRKSHGEEPKHTKPAVTDEMTSTLPKEPSHELDDEKIHEKPTEKVSEKPKEEVPAKHKETTPEAPEKPEDKVMGKQKDSIPEKPTDEVAEKPTEKVSEKLPHEVLEKPTEKVSEELPHEVLEQPTEKVPGKPTDIPGLKSPETAPSEDISPAESVFHKSPTEKYPETLSKEPTDSQSGSPSLPSEKLDHIAPGDVSEYPPIVPTCIVPEEHDASRKSSIASVKLDEAVTLVDKVHKEESPSPIKESSIVSEKLEDKISPVEAKKPESPSPTSEKTTDKPDDKVQKEKSPSPEMEDEKEMPKTPNVTPEDDKHPLPADRLEEEKSPSPTVEKLADEPKSPGLATEKAEEKKIPTDEVLSEKSPLSTSDKDTDKSQSPSLHDEVSKDKSPSPTTEKILDQSRTPTITPEKLDETDVPEDKVHEDKSPAPTFDDKIDRSRTSSITSVKHDEIHIPEGEVQKDRSPSPVEPAEKSRTPSIVSEKMIEKDILDDEDRSPSPKPEAKIDRPRTPEEAYDKDVIVEDDKSRSPSITSVKPDVKDVDEPTVQDKSPSEIADEKLDKSRAPSITPEKPTQQVELDDKIHKEKSPSPTPSSTSEKPDEKEITELEEHKPTSLVTEDKPDRSRTSSIASEKPEEQFTPHGEIQKEKSPSPSTDDKLRKPSIVSDEPEIEDISDSTIHKEKSPSPTVGEKPDKSRTPSIVPEKLTEHLIPDDKVHGDRSSSPTTDETTDKSRSPSVTSDKLDVKDIPESTAEKDKSPAIDRKPDGTRSPSITSVGPDVEDIVESIEQKDKSPSPTVDADVKPDDKVHKDKFPSPTLDQVTDKSRTPSIVSEKLNEKDTIPKDSLTSLTTDEKTDDERKPSITPEALDSKDSLHDVAQKDRTPSPAHDEDDKSRTPSVIPDKKDEKDIPHGEVQKERSPSPSTESQKPGILSEKPEEKDTLGSEVHKDRTPSPTADKIVDKSRSPSVTSEQQDGSIPETKVQKDKSPSPTIENKIDDRSRTSSISSVKLEDKDIPEDKLHKERSPAPTVDKMTDKSRSPSVTSEKPDEKEILETIQMQKDKSPSPTTDDKTDRHSRSLSPVKLDEKDIPDDKLTEDKLPSPSTDKITVPSRTPSIVPDKLDEHDVPAVQVPKDKSPSPTLEVETGRSRTSSTVSEKPEPIDSSDDNVQKDRSPSPPADKVTEKSDEKILGHEVPKDRTPSPLSDIVTDKTRSPSVTHDKLDAVVIQTDKSAKDQSPTLLDHDEPTRPENTEVVGDKTDDKSRSPSIVSEKLDKDIPSLEHPKDKSPSASTDKIIDQSKETSTTDHKPEEKVPSPVEGKLDEKPEVSEITPKVLGATDTPDDSTDKEKSPSPVSELSDKIRSPSLSSEEPEEKAPSPVGEKIEDKKPEQKSEKDRSPSPSVVEAVDKSRSPSVVSDKTEVKELLEKPKSPIVADQKSEQLVIVTKDSDKPDDKIDTLEKGKSPLGDAPKKEVSDVSESPDSIKDKPAEEKDKEITEAAKPEDVSEPSITTSGKLEDVIPVGQKTGDSSKSPSPLGEKPEKYPDTMPSAEKPKIYLINLDIGSTELTGEPEDKSRSPSVLSDRSKSPSVIDDKHDDVRPCSRASAKSEPEEPADGLKSLAPAHEMGEEKEIHKSSSDGSLPEEPKSPGAMSDKFDMRDSADSKSPRDRSPSYDKTPKDRSRSHSLFDSGDRTPLGRSRAASLFDDKLDDKIAPLDFDSHSMRPSISEEIEEDKLPVKDDDSKSGTKSPSVGDRESPVSKDDELPAAKRLEIEQYIIDEFITKKRKITSQIIEEIVIKKSVSRYIIIEIIEEIIIKLKITRESIIDFSESDEPKDDHTEVKDKESASETPVIHDKSPESSTTTKVDKAEPVVIKDTKPEESVLDSKRPSIASETSPVHDVSDEKKPRGSVTVEICDLKTTESRKSSAVDDLSVEPEPHAMKKRSIVDDYLEPKTSEPEKVETGKDDSPKPDGIDAKRPSVVDDEHPHLEPSEAKAVIETSPKVPEAEAPRKPSISGETIPEFDTPKETIGDAKKPEDQAKPDANTIPTVVAKTEEGKEIHPEGFEKEVVTVTDAKRTEIEEYIVEEYIKKGRKITREIVEEIVIKKAVPRYIILEIIEEIIIKRKISRVLVIDFVEEEVTDKEDGRSTASSISDKDDVKLRKYSEDRFELTTGKSTPEISSAKDQTIDFSGKSTPDLKSSLLSEKYSDKSGYSTPDMKQFDERSGKSTPDYRTEYESQFHKAFVGGMTEMRTTHITTLSGKSTPDFGAGREDTPEPKSESQLKPDAPAEKPDAEVHDSDSIPSKHEALDTTPKEEGKPSEMKTTDEKSWTSETTSDQSIFTTTISGITKATSELVTKISESTASSVSTVTSKILSSHSEPKTTDKSGPEGTSEVESEPEIITKVIKQEVERHEPSETEVITRTIKHVTEIEEGEPEVITKVITREFETHEPSDIEVITKTIKHVTEVEESEPEIITKVMKRESLPAEDETTISSTSTTVTKQFEVESEPEEEIITRVIRREVKTHEPSETEIITRTIRHVTEIEEGEPEIVTKVIRREVFEPADETSSTSSTVVTGTTDVDSEPERFTKIIRCGIEKHEPHETETTTRTVRHVTEVEEDEPEIIRKVIRREIVDGVEDETSTTTFTTVRTSDSESEPEIITRTIRRVVEMEDPSETEVITRTVRHVTEVEESEPEIITKVIKREVFESADEPRETETITRTVRHVTEIDEGEPEIIRKVIRREVVDGVEDDTSSTTYTTVKMSETESQPEIITRTIRRVVEMEDPSETEVITRTVRHVTEVEESEPEIITKVTRREIFVSDDEEDMITTTKTSKVTEHGDSQTSETVTRTVKSSEAHPDVVKRIISREGTPELTETITTRTTRTIVSEPGHPTETTTKTTTTSTTSDIEKPELVTRIISREGTPEISETIKRTTKTISSDAAGPEYVTRIISREGTPDIIKTSEVKRIVTTVTTVTGPDGESVTTKDVKESSDKLDDEDLLEKLIDSSSSEKSQKSAPEVTTSEERFVSETPDGLVTEEIMKRTVTTVTSTSGTSTPDVKTFVDSGKSTPDHKEDEKIAKPDKPMPEPSKDPLDKITADKTAPKIPSSNLVKDLVTEDKTYSGKSTPDIPASPLIRDSASISGRILSGKSTPDRKSDGRSRTATPEGFRSGEVIRTIITTTRTMSDDGEIITTTKEVTESTDDQGQTTILEEKTDVKRDDKLPGKDTAETAISSVIGNIKASELKRGSSPGSDVMSDRDFGPISPRSDISSGHSRAATHIWGSSEERHTYSDDDPPSSPLSATSQFGYSPQLPRYELPFDKDTHKPGAEAPSSMMTGSFYGELPTEPTTTSSAKSTFMSTTTTSKNSNPIPIQGEHSMKRFTVEKEFASGYDYRSESKKYVDDADLDFDRAMMEHREKRGEDLVSHHYSNGSSSVVYTNGNSREKSITTKTIEKTTSSGEKKIDPMAASFSAEKESEEGEKSGKDPLEGWGKPLFLPSPKPPRKFNLQRPVASTSSEELNPESLNFDVINNWGEPLRLPSPAPAPAPTNEVSNKATPGTPKKERKQPKKVVSENNKNKKRSESPSKNDKKSKDSKNKVQPVYMDLTYVPHHGNSYYSSLEFFKRIRARYYVFSGTEPSREVYDALLEAKKTWEDKNLEVTMIPTYDTDTLGYWVADNEEALAANHIDLSPSASRCTINLQDHETSCSAYRLEF